MTTSDQSCSVYLGRDLMAKLDAHIAKCMEGTPVTKRSDVPSRSSVMQRALTEYLERAEDDEEYAAWLARREHEHVYSTDPPHHCVAVPGCTMTSGRFLADVHAQAIEDLHKDS